MGLRQQLDPIRLAFGRLTQREQFMVFAGAGVGGLVLLLVVGLSVSVAIGRTEHRVKVKTNQLTQVLQLQGEYKARKAEREANLRQLGRNRGSLVSLVEEVARQSGVVIGQIDRDEGEAGPDGIVEKRVDLRASGLSADKLEKFLSRLQSRPGLLIMRRMKVKKPYRKDTLDLELTVATYELRS